MIATRAWTGLAMAAAMSALAVGAPARAEELWRGLAGTEDCRLELVNELGGVQVTAADPAASSVVVNGDPALRIEPSAPAEDPVLEDPVLRVAWAGSPADGPGDVVVSVPPHCSVAVRTTDGAVSLEVDQAAFPARVDTVTGDITAWVHPETRAAVVFATSGRITSDFTIEIEYRYHAEPSKYGSITTVGYSAPHHGQNTVRLNSRRGTVRMLQPAQDRPPP
jgi:hypothetical protein